MTRFNFDDHYWRVGGDASRVYSSKRDGYFPSDDADYLAWEEASPFERNISMIGSEEALATVLNHYGVPHSFPYKNVPEKVTMAQARIALSQAGLLSKVDDALQAMPKGAQKEAAQIAWQFSAEVSRKGDLVNALGPALGLSDDDMDDLFIAAQNISL